MKKEYLNFWMRSNTVPEYNFIFKIKYAPHKNTKNLKNLNGFYFLRISLFTSRKGVVVREALRERSLGTTSHSLGLFPLVSFLALNAAVYEAQCALTSEKSTI